MRPCQACQHYGQCHLPQDIHRLEGLIACLSVDEQKSMLVSQFHRFTETDHCVVEAGYLEP